MGVCAVFGINFRQKKASRSSCLVLGSLEPRPVWVEMGVCLNVPSRLKGIETCTSFPLSMDNNRWVTRLNVPSRLKGIETFFVPIEGHNYDVTV